MEKICLACKEGDIDIVKQIISVPGFDFDGLSDESKLPFYVACENNRLEIVKLMLTDPRISTKIDVNLAPPGSCNAFFVACCNKNVPLIKLLLTDPRTNVNDANYAGRNSFQVVSYHGDMILINLLLNDPRTNVDLLGMEDRAYCDIHYYHNFVKILPLLISNPKIDINRVDSVGRTLFDNAKEYSWWEIVDLIHNHNNRAIKYTNKEFLIACANGDLLFMKTMMSRRRLR